MKKKLNHPERDTAKKLTTRLVSLMEGETPAFLKDCEFRPVKSLEEFRGCCHLVYMEYLRMEYERRRHGELRLSVHQIIDQSTTFIALYKKEYILGTITMVQDSPLGVPMDKIFKPELDALRREGKHIIEASMLAQNNVILNRPQIPKSLRTAIILHLFKSVYEHLRKNTGVDTLVACFHPRHALFYEAMQFKALGNLKEYDDVQGSPALAYWQDMNYIGDETVMKMKEFFGLSGPKPAAQSAGQKLRFKITDFGSMLIDAKT